MRGTYDFEGVRNDPYGHELFTIVSAVHHERVRKALDDGALCFSESLLGISASGMGDVDWGADLDVIAVLMKVSLCSRFYVSLPRSSFGCSVNLSPF